MDKQIIEQLELDLEEEFSTNISDELEMQLKSLAEAYDMNVEDYLAGRFKNYLQNILDD